ncbi:MAG: DUF4340 domain-containing protein [Imperialibacter sp.]|uniref:DUF4340 domain-containing protein n=1 Tax=Imperialibacter sp. TaxID=2038411 RepID=UPI003A8B6017
MKSTLKLLGVLGILIALYFVVQFTTDRGRSKSFRSELVKIDTAAVTKLQIEANGEQLVVEKVKNQWRVNTPAGKNVAATSSSVKGILNSLMSVKPSRLVAKDESKWKDYQVDSAGTRVEVFEGGEKTLDLVVGRFNMEGQRQFSTYVRLFEEPEVYSAANFMGASLSTNSASYRNQQLARFTRDSVYQVTFEYPDSAFTLSKTDGKWLLGGQPADSANTAKYLQGIAYLSNRNFADDFNPVGSPLFSVTYLVKSGNPLKVEGYLPNGELVVHSDFNAEEYFKDASLKDKIFKGSTYFLSKEE